MEKSSCQFLQKKKKKNLPRPQSELELVVLWAVIWLERQWFTISGTDVTAENNCQMIKKNKEKQNWFVS